MKLKTLTAVLALSLSAAQAEKLTIWLVGDNANMATIVQPAADLYKAKHKDVTFEIRTIPWSDAYTKYLAAIASRTGPDIITGGLSFGISLGEQGGLINLSQKYPAFAAQVRKVAQKGVMNSITATDGTLYAVPFDLTVQLMYYRTDVLQQAGIKGAPKTWADYTKAVEKLRASGKKGAMIQWGNAGWLSYFPYLYQAGGQLYDDKCTKAVINSPEGVTALRYFADFYTKYKSPTDGWPDLEAGLASGDYPIGITGNWSLGSLPVAQPKIDGKWKAAKLPAGPTGKSTAFIGGSVMGVMSYTKVPDLAVDFMKFLYTGPAVKAMINSANKVGTLWIPARTDMASQLNLPADRKSALIAQLKDAEGPANCKGWEESGDAVQKAIQAVIFNGTDPKDALDAAAATMNRNLKK
ncbi:extracellular solute-binding protein [Deinococcus cellulosilyticus]|uniref:Sugar ABC transporter substrate-binding protein n=1 Tax=Deinococcus cellulosilyticus (strain DSM 18568 / NBRC 106333 / KACC 11606 / 5516J-15) TaxID=1223518 RepID=A0A511N4T5_DEIC1|nr:extracellular solute-binding protein [Deinococcus cellulosilyticus]GEM47874.1 sugar ABC transporter substrate-binding protein [Deinococcus cellulosilyticus NBRC 106333 = KACC 11606]